MADDLFYGLSRAELKKEITALVSKDQRSLPERAKVFSAVANMQKFDMLADIVECEELEKRVTDGAIELQRGIAPNRGVPAILYARELLLGPLYPGTLSALGHGIYLATTSVEFGKHEGFPRISRIAHEYAKKCHPGIIVRCALKKDAKITDAEGLKDFLRENRNRARDVGITDVGTFAAAFGFDGYFCDGVEPGTNERVWIVVNRGALVFQKNALQIGPAKVI